MPCHRSATSLHLKWGPRGVASRSQELKPSEELWEWRRGLRIKLYIVVRCSRPGTIQEVWRRKPAKPWGYWSQNAPHLSSTSRIWTIQQHAGPPSGPHFNKFHWCLAAEAQIRSAKRMTCTCARAGKVVLSCLLITVDKPDQLAPLSSCQHQLDKFAKTMTFRQKRHRWCQYTQLLTLKNIRWSVCRSSDFKSKLLDFLLGSPSVAWVKIWRSQVRSLIAQPDYELALRTMAHCAVDLLRSQQEHGLSDGASVFTKLR